MIALVLALLVSGAEPAYPIGQPLADVSLVDDAGRVRSIDEFRGQPLVIAPIYTRCPLACPLIASALKRAAVNATTLQSTYRVVLFSFDPRDTPADLRRFRERHQLPLAWTVATAKPDDIRRLTDSLGHHYATVKGGFTHPNLAIAVTPRLTTAAFISGTNYSAAELDRALATARGGTDWVARFGGVAIALLLFVCTISAAYLVLLLIRTREAEGARA